MSVYALHLVTEAVCMNYAGIVQRNCEIESGRRASVNIRIERGRANSGDRDYMQRLLDGVMTYRIDLRSVRNTYDRRGSMGVDIVFRCDIECLDWLERGYRDREANGENYRTRPRAPRMTVRSDESLGSLTGLRPWWSREYLVRATPESSVTTVQNRTNNGCTIGNPDSHQWVDVPLEGPTAKRCSRCLRVTGHFWRPDEIVQIVDRFVAIVKLCVSLWAQSIDVTAIRFQLLELDADKKTVEHESDNDASVRFSLLELK